MSRPLSPHENEWTHLDWFAAVDAFLRLKKLVTTGKTAVKMSMPSVYKYGYWHWHF